MNIKINAEIKALKKSNVTINKKTVPEKVKDYLYELEYEHIDYSKGERYFLTQYKGSEAACSAIYVNNLFGRNYDCRYDDKASFIVHRKRTQGKFSSVGMAGGLISNELANSGEYSELYDYLPMHMLDGINEKGVCCCATILPTIDRKSVTTGTNPGKKDVSMHCLVRHILDEAESAEDAINKIKNDYNIISTDDVELHYMIADSNNCYVVEFIDNAAVIVDNFNDGLPITTNFYLHGFDGTKNTLTPHARGFERYNILKSHYNEVSSSEELHSLLRNCFFTNAYTITDEDDVWYSDFTGDYDGFGDITINSTKAQFGPILNYCRNLFENRIRDGKTWQTVHSTVYDINNKSFTVVIQEEKTNIGTLILSDKINIDNKYEIKSILDSLRLHESDYNNPHQVTKAHIGLGNVDNTHDANKPISNPTKKYVDDKIGNCVEKTNSRYILYGTDRNGEPINIAFAMNSPDGLSIVRRKTNGEIAIGEPVNDGDATTKKYVDDRLAAIIQTISEQREDIDAVAGDLKSLTARIKDSI